MKTTGLTIIKNAWAQRLSDLEKYYKFYAKWETVLEFRCMETMTAIIAVETTINLSKDFFSGKGYRDSRISLIVSTLQGFSYYVDEAAIAVRSYQPLCLLETERAFRQQKSARDRLNILIRKVKELIESINAIQEEGHK